MTRTILLLAGTGEARRLAAELADHDLRVISSLAGRTREPRLPPGEVRIGGFGGINGLQDWLQNNKIDAVVDATHPFAAVITASAAQATTNLEIPFLVLRRPGWKTQPGDDWRWVDSIQAAASELPGKRVFLTTGREELAAFAHLNDHWFLARSVEPPQPPMPQHIHVLLGRGPFTVDGELATMRDHKVDVLVTKDSGGEMTAAKLVAARQLSLPVVIVRRPPLPDVASVASVAEVVTWLGIGGV